MDLALLIAELEQHDEQSERRKWADFGLRDQLVGHVDGDPDPWSVLHREVDDAGQRAAEPVDAHFMACRPGFVEPPKNDLQAAGADTSPACEIAVGSDEPLVLAGGVLFIGELTQQSVEAECAGARRGPLIVSRIACTARRRTMKNGNVRRSRIVTGVVIGQNRSARRAAARSAAGFDDAIAKMRDGKSIVDIAKRRSYQGRRLAF